MEFRVELDGFRGPLDLLLYLVRKHEVDVVEIPITAILDQYLEYLAILERLDIAAVADFVAVASTLIEIKSQEVLPHGDEVDRPLDEAHRDLVVRLLEYKEFRDAATVLEERGLAWQQQFARQESDLVEGRVDPAEEPIREVELWDLVSAFGRIAREVEAARPANIVYDETPIHVYMARIHAEAAARGRLAFRELFLPGMHRSHLAGMFLAILELARHDRIHLEQDRLFDDIWLLPAAAETSAAPVDP